MVALCACSGIVRHRVVGSPTASSDVDLAAEIENAFQILNKAKPWNFSLSVSGILPPLPAPSASSTLDPVSGELPAFPLALVSACYIFCFSIFATAFILC